MISTRLYHPPPFLFKLKSHPAFGEDSSSALSFKHFLVVLFYSPSKNSPTRLFPTITHSPVCVCMCFYCHFIFPEDICDSSSAPFRAQAGKRGSNRAVSGPDLICHRQAGVGVNCLSFPSAKWGQQECRCWLEDREQVRKGEMQP